MRIVPFRVRFDVDVDSDTGKYRYSKPTEDILPVELSEDGTYYEIHTHDRGEHEEPGPYYQIAFRIEDPSPYRLEELQLSIDLAIFRNSDQPIDNDLYCDPETRDDLQRNLWYQRSRYEQDSQGNWRIIPENKKSSLRVECITTSGVFRVVVLRNGTILHGIELPWVYVLPSAISQKDYVIMLNDLITLHERLIRDDKSTVGIGELTQIESATERVKKDIVVTKRLYEAIRGVMALPSERQSKRYKKTTINKVRHFDSKVVRDYIRNGMSGKVLGIEFYEDHDTYENRIVKYYLRQIAKRHSMQPRFVIDPDVDIDTALRDEMKMRTQTRHASQAEPVGNMRTFCLHGQPPTNSAYHSLRVEVQANTVKITDHAPFRGDGRSWVKFHLVASSRREILFYLSHLVQCFDRISNESVFTISCAAESPSIQTTGWNNTVYTYVISNIRSIDDQAFDPDIDDCSEDEYRRKLQELSSGRDYIFCSGGFYIQNRHRAYHKPINQDDEERKGMEEDIKTDIERKKENATVERELWVITECLINLLDESWFQGISDIDCVTEIRLTPKFQSNRFYAAIYDSLIEMLEDHPLLSNSFDINAFGVGSTQLVYEYWVFYKLLYQLKTIGFRIDKRSDLVDHFQSFVSGKQPASKYSKYKATAIRTLADGDESQTITAEIGYDIVFYTDNTPDGKRLQRTPDYYLHIYGNGSDHWYFMDAKYKCFSKNTPHMLNYAQEIYDVAISKYIFDIGTIFTLEPVRYHATPNSIYGAYIIAANIDDYPHPIELSGNNRLYGAPTSILADSSLNQWNQERVTAEVLDNGREGTPAHRYGVIRLIPSYDGELQSLFQLIFEYLETGKSDDHRNLHYCWSCGFEGLAIRQTKYPTKPVVGEFGEIEYVEDHERYPKYYVRCPRCKAFRVDNHCINCGRAIIKHTKGNFHRWDDSVDSSQWAFLCPDCGSPVNGFVSDSETEVGHTAGSPEEIMSYGNDDLPF